MLATITKKFLIIFYLFTIVLTSGNQKKLLRSNSAEVKVSTPLFNKEVQGSKNRSKSLGVLKLI